jgi:hypothetical protein
MVVVPGIDVSRGLFLTASLPFTAFRSRRFFSGFLIFPGKCSARKKN